MHTASGCFGLWPTDTNDVNSSGGRFQCLQPASGCPAPIIKSPQQYGLVIGSLQAVNNRQRQVGVDQVMFLHGVCDDAAWPLVKTGKSR